MMLTNYKPGLALAFVLFTAIALFVPEAGSTAVLVGGALALAVGLLVARAGHDRGFLLNVFVVGLILRVLVGTLIYGLDLHLFFGGDAITYDQMGWETLRSWRGEPSAFDTSEHYALFSQTFPGILYMVAATYALAGRNMLAFQYVNAVIGAATAPVIYLCAHHIFRNVRVARLSALFIALYPSLVLWSSQGLKDGPIVFLLALCMLATLRLGERVGLKNVTLLALSLVAILSLRFYIFYMVAAAVGASFFVGMRTASAQGMARQLAAAVGIGLALTYMGVLRSANTQIEQYSDLRVVQASRAEQAKEANTGFGADLDVSTPTGALAAIPLGMAYLLLAPFPWQLANLRQSITLPEMMVWWACMPLLVLGLYFTLKHRLRQSMPILLFTLMLTLAYSVFQGNVGTAYRQRAQLLAFYFIYVSAGAVLLKERREEKQWRAWSESRAGHAAIAAARRRRAREADFESLAARLKDRAGF